MTSIMRRPQSTQPGDFGRADLSRTLGRSHIASDPQQHAGNGNAGNGNGNAYSVSSPSALGMLGSDPARISSLPSYDGMLGGSDASSSSGMAGGLGAVAVDANSSMLTGMAQHRLPTHPLDLSTTTTTNAATLEGLDLDTRTIFDDPGILSLAKQSQGPSSTSDLDFGLENPASSSFFSSSRIAGPSASLSHAFSDVDLTSSGILQFPELPASLLDQAPEYEYSVHTQSNVFDAVQDYSGSGEDEAARVFGLDHYDPSINQEVSRQSIHQDGAQGNWEPALYGANHRDSLQTQTQADPQQSLRAGHPTSYSHAQLGSGEGVAAFPESGSMVSSSEYPVEPSTAPTSRASEWKFESSSASIGSDTNIHDASFSSMKHRRDSYDDFGREGSTSATATSNSPSTLFSYQQANPQHTRDDDTAFRSGASHHHHGPLVPSQGGASTAIHSRGRIASWGGENVHYVDDWSALPNHGSTQVQGMPAPSSGAFRSGYPSIPSMVGRMGQFGVDASSRGGRPDMMQALGSAMDASMETDGVAKCPYPNCTKTFAKNRSYNLKAHLRSHSQLKPYQCTHCPRAFSRKHDLERHSRVHSGDKPYLCEACGKGFPRSDALRRHWRVEKECGDKAVEIEAKQPLPSLPPGINVPTAHANGPMPGVMHVGPSVTTSMSGGGMPSSVSAGGGLHSYSQLQHQQVQLQHHHHNQQQAQHGQSHSFQQQQQQGGNGGWSSASAMAHQPVTLNSNTSSGAYNYHPQHPGQMHDARLEPKDR